MLLVILHSGLNLLFNISVIQSSYIKYTAAYSTSHDQQKTVTERCILHVLKLYIAENLLPVCQVWYSK